MPESVDQIRERSLAKASQLGHDMELLASSPDTAFYVCRSYKLAFTIGHVSSSRRTKERRGIQLIADTALTTPCSAE